MASGGSTNPISKEQRRWVVVGICLNTVLAPVLRENVKTELDKWHCDLCKPPDEIHKQVPTHYKKNFSSSKHPLQYKNINNNSNCKSPKNYDYAVKDSLSLAKLFPQPHMAHFTGFDETMDMSGLLIIVGEAAPFVSSGVAVEAKKVRSDIRNPWAHCNFSEWTVDKLNASFQAMESLVKKINLPAADKKKACDDLDFWMQTDIFVAGGRHAKLVTDSIAELCRCVKNWKLEEDAKINPVVENLDIILKLLCRMQKVENATARNVEDIQRLKQRTEHQHAEKQNYSEFVAKKVPYGLRKLPRDMLERPSEVNEILKLLTEGNSSVGVVGRRSRDVVGIRGMGGLGKTTLALAVAWAVSADRQVIWLDIGEDPNCFALISILIKVLGGNVSFSDIRAAQSWIQENTSDKDCLVILDDVWKVNHASAFDHLSGKCQLLITTRDSDVFRGLQGSALYNLQLLQRGESAKLLYQSARVTTEEQSKFSSNLRQIVKELLNHCRDLPLALSLVGSSLVDTRDEQDWEDVLNDLKNADLAQLRSLYSADAYPYDSLLAVINASFIHLEERIQEKFLDFAVFPEDTNIPLDILELFWSLEGAGRTSCQPREARCVLDTLEKKSLIQKASDGYGKKTYHLHDLILDFARGKLGEKLRSVQCLFVEALRGQCEKGDWGKFQGNKNYYFKYLTYHLHSSEQLDELNKLLFNFHWLSEKVNQFDLPSLLSDFRFLNPPSKEIELLKSSLMLSSGAIEMNVNYIGPHLLGRLLSYAGKFSNVKTLTEQIRITCAKMCYLLPLSSCFDIGGAEISRRNFNSRVCSIATSNASANTLVMCGFGNGSITIYEIETGREVQQLLGHDMEVTCLALSQNETILASGSHDKTAILWNMDSYEQLFILQVDDPVDALAFSVDNQHLFTGSYTGLLSVWFLSTGKLLNSTAAHDTSVWSLCTTAYGQYVATASPDDNFIKLWRADRLSIQATLVGHTGAVTCVVPADAGKDNPMLVSVSLDCTIKIWDLKMYQEIRTLKGHKTEVWSVAVSDDKKHIITGDDDGLVMLWCFHTGKLISCFEGHTRCISCVAIISDGSKTISASHDGTVRVWNLALSLYMEQKRSSDCFANVTDIALSRDGSICVSASRDVTFKIWKCETSVLCFTLRGNGKWVKCVAVSAESRYFVSLLKKDDFSFSIKVWDVYNGSGINEIDISGTPEIVRFSSDGLQVIIGCKDYRLYIWDWHERDTCLKIVILPTFHTVEIACDQSLIYTCSRNMHVCVVNLGSLQVSTVRQGLAAPVISPDGEAVILVAMNEIMCWKHLSRRKVKYNAGHPKKSILTAIDITSNGKFALTGSSSGTMSLVDLKFSKIIQTFTKTESGVGIRFVCVVSDDSRFVFVDEANKIELRTFNNNEARIELEQPDVQVTCITAFGLNILLGCDNGKLLWFRLADTSQCKFQAHLDSVSQVRSDLEGLSRRLVTGSVGGSVKLWNVEENLLTLLWSHENIYSAPINALSFVPNSHDVIIGSGGKVYRLSANGGIHSYSTMIYESDKERIETMCVVGDFIFCVASNNSRYTSDVEKNIRVIKWRLNNVKFLNRIPISFTEKVLRVKNSCSVAILGRDSLVIRNFRTGTILGRLPIENAWDITALALAPRGEIILSASHEDKKIKLWKLQNGECTEVFHFDQHVLAIACASNGMVCAGLNGGQLCFLRFNSLSSHSKQIERQRLAK